MVCVWCLRTKKSVTTIFIYLHALTRCFSAHMKINIEITSFERLRCFLQYTYLLFTLFLIFNSFNSHIVCPWWLLTTSQTLRPHHTQQFPFPPYTLHFIASTRHPTQIRNKKETRKTVSIGPKRNSWRHDTDSGKEDYLTKRWSRPNTKCLHTHKEANRYYTLKGFKSKSCCWEQTFKNSCRLCSAARMLKTQLQLYTTLYHHRAAPRLPIGWWVPSANDW